MVCEEIGGGRRYQIKKISFFSLNFKFNELTVVEDFKMTFEKITITIHSFRGIESAIYMFYPGLNLLKGMSGVGKSTILQAIRWTLYKEPISGNNAFFKKITTKTPNVRLQFYGNKDDVDCSPLLDIHRVASPQNFTVITPSGCYESHEAECYICDFFGSDSFFRAVSYVQQNHHNILLENHLNKSEQREIFQSLACLLQDNQKLVNDVSTEEARNRISEYIKERQMDTVKLDEMLNRNLDVIQEKKNIQQEISKTIDDLGVFSKEYESLIVSNHKNRFWKTELWNRIREIRTSMDRGGHHNQGVKKDIVIYTYKKLETEVEKHQKELEYIHGNQEELVKTRRDLFKKIQDMESQYIHFKNFTETLQSISLISPVYFKVNTWYNSGNLKTYFYKLTKSLELIQNIEKFLNFKCVDITNWEEMIRSNHKKRIIEDYTLFLEWKDTNDKLINKWNETNIQLRILRKQYEDTKAILDKLTGRIREISNKLGLSYDKNLNQIEELKSYLHRKGVIRECPHCDHKLFVQILDKDNVIITAENMLSCERGNEEVIRELITCTEKLSSLQPVFKKLEMDYLGRMEENKNHEQNIEDAIRTKPKIEEVDLVKYKLLYEKIYPLVEDIDLLLIKPVQEIIFNLGYDGRIHLLSLIKTIETYNYTNNVINLDEIKNLKEELVILDEKLRNIHEVENIRKKIEELNKNIVHLKELEKLIDKFNIQYPDLSLDSILTDEGEFSLLLERTETWLTMRTELSKITDDVLKLEHGVSVLKENIRKNQEDVDNLTALSFCIDEVEERVFNNTIDRLCHFTNTLLREVFDNGVIPQLVIQLDNKKGRSGSKASSSGLNIQFGWETIFDRDAVTILDSRKQGSLRSIDSFSGGESDRLSLAFTCACSLLSDSPFLILDECISSLDTELRDRVIRTLRTIRRDKFIIVICHDTVDGLFDHIIPVV